MVLVVAGYFVYLGAVALVARVPARRRARALAVAIAGVAVVAMLGVPHIMPLLFLLVGYWLPALLVRAPDVALEQRLLEADRGLFGSDGLVSFHRQAPRMAIEYLELAYLCCYAVVPAGYVWLVLAGFEHEAERFWTSVLLAGFFCYGLLPWMPTRAPRALEPEQVPARSAVRRMNLAVLDRASVQWNTFPSGHTAASVATALALGSVVPEGGIVLGFIAVSIAIGSVVGRYHYAADAVSGLVAAILAFALATAVLAP